MLTLLELETACARMREAGARDDTIVAVSDHFGEPEESFYDLEYHKPSRRRANGRAWISLVGVNSTYPEPD